MSSDSEQCWKCRLISGSGLIGAGSYVVHYGRQLKGFERYGVTLIGCGIGIIGLLRLFGSPLITSKNSLEKSTTVNEDEYVIGNFTSKIN